MNAHETLRAILHAIDKGEDPALILDENSPLMDAAREAVKAPSQAGSCQASGPCKTCRGSGVVDDGWMTHSDGGAEFNEPIKCVKDCPDCRKPASKTEPGERDHG